jgi:hypothetical protein
MLKALAICVLLVTLWLARPPLNRLNGQCVWTNDLASTVDPRSTAGASHLKSDAMVAEELSIRYADITRGHRSGHFIGTAEYVRSRERCLDRLISRTARNHGVQPQELRQFIGRRQPEFDFAVLFAFAAIYAVACQAMARALVSRVPLDERAPAAIATVAVSAMMGATATAMLGLWAEGFEMFRVADTHMSYRVGRSPWTHHTTELFIAAVALFVFSAVRWYLQTAQRSLHAAA